MASYIHFYHFHLILMTLVLCSRGPLRIIWNYAPDSQCRAPEFFSIADKDDDSPPTSHLAEALGRNGMIVIH
jgi:hypothetical protein